VILFVRGACYVGPHRERLGWLEVSHLVFPALAFNFDISRLWAKISLDTVDSQLPSGLVPDIAPEYTVFSGGFRDSPEWGSAAVLNPAWLHSWYGNTAIVNATYGTARRYVDYLLSQRTGAGILAYGLGDWIPVVASPVGVTATAILVQDLAALAVMATAIGDHDAAANYTALSTEVAAAYTAAFGGASGGDYPTQCAAGMALALGITPAAAVPEAHTYIVGDVVQRGEGTSAAAVVVVNDSARACARRQHHDERRDRQ
jgi:alpha-L-rhamnosidase